MGLHLPVPSILKRTTPPPPPPLENILIQLNQYEVVILMDDSSSMAGERWEQVRDASLSIVMGLALIVRVSGEESYERSSYRSGQVR